MASAGRILIMPKGAYDASATYEMLDMVSHNGTTWLAKKTVSNVEPSAANNEFWHSMFDFDPADVESRKANGGVEVFLANPEGNDYVIHTFEGEHTADPVYFTNIAGSTTVYVTGINITNFLQNGVEVKIFLNQPYDGQLTFVAGYLY